MPRWRAASINFGQCFTGIDLRRFISEAVEARTSSAAATAAGPPNFSKISGTVSMQGATYILRVNGVNMNYVNILHDYQPMQTKGERLQWAREKAGFSSKLAAAKRFGWTASTYAAHENGQNDYDDKPASKYAKAFKVSAGWLLTGEGSPSPKSNKHPVVNYVGGGSELVPIDDYPIGEGIKEIELPAGVPANAVVVEVKGESMHPRYYDGEYLVYIRDGRSPEELVGRECVVELTDGRKMVKTVRRGSKRGLFRLESFNASPIEDVKIKWAGYVWRPGVTA
jgi:phage repressor protein C with HTH and peptisase S24 domain